MKPLILIGLLACSASLSAAPKVLLETPVTLEPGVAVTGKVAQDCPLEDLLARKVGPALNAVNKPHGKQKKSRKGEAADAKPKAAEPAPQVLRLHITGVEGIDGEEDSKTPKSISVLAEILEKGKLLRKTELSRSNTGGFLSRFKSTCSVLEGAAGAIAKEVAEWAGDPSYQVGEESSPKGKGKGKGKPIENTIPAGNGAR